MRNISEFVSKQHEEITNKLKEHVGTPLYNM